MNQLQVKDEFQHCDERISSIYDGEYFRILHRKDDNLIVQCITCGPDAPQLRASRRSNGNILKHIQRRHSELLAKIRIEKNIKCRAVSCGSSRRTSNKADVINKALETKLISASTLSEDSKPRMVFIEASTSDSIGNFQYLDRNECSDGENVQLLQTDDNIISEEQEATDFINHENLNEIDHQHQPIHKQPDMKSDHMDYDDCHETSCSEDLKTKSNLDKELVELKKELMLREFDELQEMRREKHRFEIEILRRELEFKKIEHRKKIELLDKQLRDK